MIDNDKLDEIDKNNETMNTESVNTETLNTESVKNEIVKDGINKIDAIDNSEMPSRTKLSAIISQTKNKKTEEGFTDADGMYHEKKVGFLNLTASYFIKWWPMGLVVVIFIVIAAFSTAVGPWIMNNLISAAKQAAAPNPNEPKPFWDISWQSYMYIQIGLFVIVAVSTLIANMTAGFIGKRIEIQLRNKATERLITQDISYYSNKKIGEILTKVMSDTQIIGDQSQGIPVQFISAIFTTAFSIAFMFVIDWKVALVGIGLFLIIIFSIMLTFGSLRGLMLKVRNVITKINGTVINRVNTVQLIKTSGTEEYEKELFAKLHVDYQKAFRKMILIQSIVITCLLVGINSIQVVLTVSSVFIYQDNSAYLISMLPSMILAVGIMITPLMQMVRVISGIVIASSSSQRIASIINSKSQINPHLKPNEGIQVNHLKGDIIFKNVTFAYPEKPEKIIIPDFNMTFEKGKKYAFVGETGSGKSTISKLLLRFYDPTFGAVLINENTNLKDVNLPSYLSNVGYVEQDPAIFLGNVYENVKYGSKGATNQEVIEACKKADLHKLISSWPDGYNTVLGERGFMLSGGQKQRLVIARMFLKDPQLLILDEATSALDNIVEKEIQAQLEKLMKGRTTISIAHRLSTIRKADQIIVLGSGKGIVQTGTFKELKTKPGHFKKLYEAGLMK